MNLDLIVTIVSKSILYWTGSSSTVNCKVSSEALLTATCLLGGATVVKQPLTKITPNYLAKAEDSAALEVSPLSNETKKRG